MLQRWQMQQRLKAGKGLHSHSSQAPLPPQSLAPILLPPQPAAAPIVAVVPPLQTQAQQEEVGSPQAVLKSPQQG